MITPVVHTSFRRNAESVKPSVRSTMEVWRRLKDDGHLGQVSIYPAIGVDVLAALVTRVVGVNLYPFNASGIMEHISPILSLEFAERIKPALRRPDLSYHSRVDARDHSALKKVLSRYRDISPKSLILKHYFEYAFLREWDMDSERYYDVDKRSAVERAQLWTENMVKWLKPGDTVIDFDPIFHPLLKDQKKLLVEVKTAISRDSRRSDVVYERVIPVISLPDYAWVFKRA